uniref:Secreted protein n=1 Tax=Panagrellus redivivus TaxID=6233 RepID=A0A7E4ZUX5_PANRE
MMEVICFGLLYLLIGNVCIAAEPTRVYNAKARSINGSHDMNIQVIQVGIINFDQAGRPITVTPPPVEVHDEIKDKVAWSPEKGVIFRIPQKPDPNDDLSVVKEFPAGVSGNLDNALMPKPFQSSYFPSVASTHVSSRRRKNESSHLVELIIASVVAFACVGVFVFLVTRMIRKRAEKRRRARTEGNTMVYYQPINGTNRLFIRPEATLDREPSTTASHDYENMSDLDETSEVSVRPPPIPPRRARMGAALNQHLGYKSDYVTLDQPVGWLLDTSVSSRNSPASSVARLKLNSTASPIPPPRPPRPIKRRRRGSM